jgi:hypothetical protein
MVPDMQLTNTETTNKTLTSPKLNSVLPGYVWTATDASGNGSWQAATGGGSSALSAITAPTATNTINGANFAQEWQWNTLAGATTGFKLSSSSTAAASDLQTIFEV